MRKKKIKDQTHFLYEKKILFARVCVCVAVVVAEPTCSAWVSGVFERNLSNVLEEVKP